jgi:hypothetical protein
MPTNPFEPPKEVILVSEEITPAWLRLLFVPFAVLAATGGLLLVVHEPLPATWFDAARYAVGVIAILGITAVWFGAAFNRFSRVVIVENGNVLLENSLGSRRLAVRSGDKIVVSPKVGIAGSPSVELCEQQTQNRHFIIAKHTYDEVAAVASRLQLALATKGLVCEVDDEFNP